MLKVQTSSSDSHQRRPMRILSSYETQNRMREAATSNNSSGSSSTNGSRLKCSTISKVPPAKSRLKQSVDTSASQRQQQICSSEQETQKPSRLARLCVARSLCSNSHLAVANKGESPQVTPSTNAPTSTTTAASTKLLTSNNLAVGSSSSSRLNNKLESANKSPFTQRAPQLANTNQEIRSAAAAAIAAKKVQPQSNAKRKYFSTAKSGTVGTGSQVAPSSRGPVESRLSGGLRNLVAVVRPQHSQRVNSSATTITQTNTNKLLPQHQQQPPTTTTKSQTQSRFESGKVNFNHKDVNGRLREEKREKESKQDGSQIKAAHPQCQFTKTTTESMINARDSLNPTSVCSPTSTTNDDRDKSDQFNSRQEDGNFSQHLLSVASTNNGDLCDKKQHGNNKQSNKHLSGQAGHSSLAQADTDNHDNAQVVDSDSDSCLQQNENNNNNCYYHDEAESNSTKTAILHSKHNTSAHSINDRIQPKPMGQQVLSLMMLDVGLLPANNHNQAPTSLPPKSGHVRIAGSSRQDRANADTASSSPFFSSATPSSTAEISALNEVDNSGFINCNFDSKQCRTLYSLQPEHEMLHLQVHSSNRSNAAYKSISLPSSPRLRSTRGVAGESHVERNAPLDCQPTNQLKHESCRKFVLPDFCTGHSKCNNQNRFLSDATNIQDSLSMASSSSSLNYYPPQLTLSNQLNGLKFEELVRANSTSTATLHSNQNNQSNLSFNPKNKSRHSSKQVAQAIKQHENLTTDLHNEAYDEYQSAKINRESTEDKLEEDLLTSGTKFTEMVQKINNCLELKLEQAAEDKEQSDESCSDPQLSRRHQHPRSHSISGQDYCTNGGYQRLKQSLYVQPAPYDGHQQYTVPGGGRSHQSPSPYQYHHVVGRSPSPMSPGGQAQYNLLQRDGSFKSSQERQVRNHLHASLECLNSGYADFNQTSNQMYQQNSHQQQHQMQNQHYASGYVLAPPPANTIINQNGDRDMAAAAMGAISTQYQPSSNPLPAASNSYSNQNQALINRAIAQVAQSPLRRIGLHTTNVATSSGLLNHISSLHQPMRAGHSSLSLATSSFMIEDKLQNEIRKLQGELKSEKEKNEALSSQLNINSNLMAAFEQSLTTLNTRLRQLTTLNEKKDNEIEELRVQLKSSNSTSTQQQYAKKIDSSTGNFEKLSQNGENDSNSEDLIKLVEELKRKLVEKERILKDTRVEALKAALQLEQLESKLNGEHSILINDDDLDEGVMVVNHSPSDSDPVTDSTHFNDLGNNLLRTDQCCSSDSSAFVTNSNSNNRSVSTNNNSVDTNNFSSLLDTSRENNNSTNMNNTDTQSNHSSDYLVENREGIGQTISASDSQHFEDSRSNLKIGEIMDSLLISN